MTLQAYRVIGRGFHVGAGALLLVSQEQAEDRRHKLELVKPPHAGFGLVTAKETQAFKPGELLGLTEMPKGQLQLVEQLAEPARGSKKDDPDVRFYLAVHAFNAAAVEAEARQQRDAEEAERKRLAAAQAAADAVDVEAWTLEFNTLPAVKEKYPKLDAYIAARKAERAQQQQKSAS